MQITRVITDTWDYRYLFPKCGLVAGTVKCRPNAASCERLVTGVLIEISEGWETVKVYLSMDE